MSDEQDIILVSNERTPPTEKVEPAVAEPDAVKTAEALDNEPEPEESELAADEDGGEEETTDEESEKHPKKKGGFKRRIDRLNRKNAELENELARLRAAVEGKTAEPAQTLKLAGKPDPEKFDTHSEYLEALTDWKVEQRLQAVREQEEQSKAQAETAKKVETWKSKVANALEHHPDLEELLENDIPTSPAMAEVMLESDHGGEIMYFLATHPDESRRISKLSPLQAAKELGKIEDRISASKEQPKLETKVSKAPKPPAPVGVKGSASSNKSPDEMDFEEYKAWRQQQLKKGR